MTMSHIINMIEEKDIFKQDKAVEKIHREEWLYEKKHQLQCE